MCVSPISFFTFLVQKQTKNTKIIFIISWWLLYEQWTVSGLGGHDGVSRTQCKAVIARMCMCVWVSSICMNDGHVSINSRKRDNVYGFQCDTFCTCKNRARTLCNRRRRRQWRWQGRLKELPADNRQMFVCHVNSKETIEKLHETKSNVLWLVDDVPSMPSKVGKSFDTSYSKATLLRLLISYVKPEGRSRCGSKWMRLAEDL